MAGRVGKANLVMSSRGQWLVLSALLLATIAGFALVYDLRLSHGDSFPPYSSLRADPLGTRGLYDSLAELPELRVTREFGLQGSAISSPHTLIIAGSDHGGWQTYDEEQHGAIERAARSGSRVVIALRAFQEHDDEGVKKPAEDTEKSDKKKKSTDAESAATKKEVEPMPLKERWLVEVATRWLLHDAVRDAEAPAVLPEQLRWGSEVIFMLSADSPWRVLYRRGEEPVLIERTFGRGSIVLVGDAYILSNEALQRDRSAALLAWLIGPHTTIVFDEGHLGLQENRGIASLARKYGLAGAFMALLLAAGLFIWNRMALFVPSAPEREEIALSYNQTAGLEALLRRALTPGELTAASVEEWRKTARPSDIARVEAALLAAPKNASPVSTYNIIVHALRRR